MNAPSVKKHCLLFIACAFAAVHVFAQPAAKEFVLKGKIAGLDSGFVHLYYEFNKTPIRDSVRISAEGFLLKGLLEYPTRATFSIFGDFVTAADSNQINFFIEPSPMELKSSANNLNDFTLTGSATDTDRLRLARLEKPMNDSLKPLTEQSWYIYKQYKKAVNDADSAKAKEFNEQLNIVSKQQYRLWDRKKHIDSAFIVQNLHCFVAADMIWRNYVRFKAIHFPSLENLYHEFPEWLKDTRQGQAIKYKIEQEYALTNGKPAPNFITKDLQGNTISLSDYKGKKYVRLDFWASWCGPCRQITPYLKELYAEYAPKGLEIISISGDKEKKAWLKALKEDKMPWPQIIVNVQAMPVMPADKLISEIYFVQYIPTLVLIDKEQKIVKKFEIDSDTRNSLFGQMKGIFNE
jgi:thiol-disulfide isomerase/thioredoxin